MIKSIRLFRYLLHLCLPVFLSPGFSYAQLISSEVLQTELINVGFENVCVVSITDSVIVSYENRVYRHEVDGLDKVIELTRGVFPGKYAVIVPRKNNMAVCRIDISNDYPQMEKSGEDNYQAEISYNLDGIEKLFAKKPLLNSTQNRFEFIIIPQLKIQFGDYHDPIQSQINFAPMLNINLGKGLNFRGQFVFPLQNKLAEEGDSIRPGIISLSQVVRLSNSAFLSINVGHFTYDRIGFYSELYNYFLYDEFYVDLKGGYTGDSHFFGDKINFGGINTFTGFIGGGYWYPGYDLVTEIGYGKFLYGDTGWKINVKRYFGEVEIGFSSILTSKGDNFGVNVSIPIFPSKYWKPSFVSVRPLRYYHFKYKFEGFPNYGSEFETGGEIDNFLHQLQPVFLKNHINFLK